MKRIKVGLLTKIAIAIALGIGCGLFLPDAIARIFVTFNDIFSNFLSFSIPLVIVGLVTPAIADIGKGAGRLLILTVILAYGFTIMSGFMTFATGEIIFPKLLEGATLHNLDEQSHTLAPYFSIEMPPVMSVMTALVLAFVVGLGLSVIKNQRLKGVVDDFKEIIMLLIERVIIPLLPLYIFGIFMGITTSGQVARVLGVFIKLIVVIFALTALLLVIQFVIAGVIAHKRPMKMLRTMMTAYVTALGTQSSAATIPVTLESTIKCGVRPEIAGFTVPLCATIHLSGSTLKITGCALAIMILEGIPIDPATFAGFIMMLGITMVAAPGVPGGAIMAATGILQTMLGFDATAIGLMIALYITMDSFGTATNVTGDGAISLIINRIAQK
jgi:Na+/H+-dicarboxylate symporter